VIRRERQGATVRSTFFRAEFFHGGGRGASPELKPYTRTTCMRRECRCSLMTGVGFRAASVSDSGGGAPLEGLRPGGVGTVGLIKISPSEMFKGLGARRRTRESGTLRFSMGAGRWAAQGGGRDGCGPGESGLIAAGMWRGSKVLRGGGGSCE